MGKLKRLNSDQSSIFQGRQEFSKRFFNARHRLHDKEVIY